MLPLSSSKLYESYEIRRFCVFSHTSKEEAIFGIIEVFKEYYRVGGSKFGLIDVKFSKPLSNQVMLSDVKRSPLLKNMAILKQPPLSVSQLQKSNGMK